LVEYGSFSVRTLFVKAVLHTQAAESRYSLGDPVWFFFLNKNDF